MSVFGILGEAASDASVDLVSVVCRRLPRRGIGGSVSSVRGRALHRRPRAPSGRANGVTATASQVERSARLDLRSPLRASRSSPPLSGGKISGVAPYTAMSASSVTPANAQRQPSCRQANRSSVSSLGSGENLSSTWHPRTVALRPSSSVDALNRALSIHDDVVDAPMPCAVAT